MKMLLQHYYRMLYFVKEQNSSCWSLPSSTQNGSLKPRLRPHERTLTDLLLDLAPDHGEVDRIIE